MHYNDKIIEQPDTLSDPQRVAEIGKNGKDLYQILGLNIGASAQAIASAYKIKASQNAPGNAIWSDISDSYQTLSDVNLRRIYDTNLLEYLQNKRDYCQSGISAIEAYFRAYTASSTTSADNSNANAASTTSATFPNVSNSAIDTRSSSEESPEEKLVAECTAANTLEDIKNIVEKYCSQTDDILERATHSHSYIDKNNTKVKKNLASADKYIRIVKALKEKPADCYSRIASLLAHSQRWDILKQLIEAAPSGAIDLGYYYRKSKKAHTTKPLRHFLPAGLAEAIIKK